MIILSATVVVIHLGILYTTCGAARRYWVGVILNPNNLLGINLNLNPLTYILGYYDSSLMDDHLSLSVTRSLFTVSRVLAVK